MCPLYDLKITYQVLSERPISSYLIKEYMIKCLEIKFRHATDITTGRYKSLDFLIYLSVNLDAVDHQHERLEDAKVQENETPEDYEKRIHEICRDLYNLLRSELLNL